MRSAARQRGFLLIAAVVIIVAAGVMALVIVTLVAGGSRAGTQHVQSSQALFLARTGLEHGSRLLLSPVLAERLPCAALAGDPAITDAALGTGTYTVSGAAPFYPSPPPALAAPVSATDTTITLSTAAGLAPAGRMLIDRETIHYAEISTCSGDPCLIGVQRGRDGTAAAAHAAGTPLGQYQCNLTSAGSVPDGAAAERGQRTLGWGAQLQEGWIVGANGSVLRWNGVGFENVWQTTAVPTGTQLNAVSMLSYADGWAVGNMENPPGPGGNQEIILRWTGTAWVVMPEALSPQPDPDLHDVHCTASDDCWIVGQAVNPPGPGGDQETILHWAGSQWSLTGAAGGSVPDVDLNSVHCAARDDCWAVGDEDGNAVIIRLSGGPNWSRFNAPAAPDVNLNAIYCVSSNDCWAVGDDDGEEVIIRWDGGGAWTRQPPVAAIPDVDLNSVHCNASDDCRAVGDEDGALVIIRWTGGPDWIRQATAGIAAVDLNSVHCVDSNDCWAVGDASAGPVVVHWDGAAWSRFDPTGLPNENLLSAYIIGDRLRADAAWREIFP